MKDSAEIISVNHNKHNKTRSVIKVISLNYVDEAHHPSSPIVFHILLL